MKTVSSAELGQERIKLGEESGILDIYDNLGTPYSGDVIELTPEHAAQIEEYAVKAAINYGDKNAEREPTYIQTELGLPALIVRIDCTVVDGQIMAFEMEDSPSGIGITDRLMTHTTGTGITSAVLGHYEDAVGSIPHVIVSGTRGHGTDDKMVVGSERYHYRQGDLRPPRLPEDQLVIVKAIPGNIDSSSPYQHLKDKLLAPLSTEGDKSYLVRMGELAVVESEDDLLVDERGELLSQVLKARLGSMAMGISVYLTPEDRTKFGKGGQVKIGRLRRDLVKYLSESDGALVQQFRPPIQIENAAGCSNTILRMFVLLNNSEGVTTGKTIGGCYVARPELIVHGARNAISGAVLVE